VKDVTSDKDVVNMLRLAVIDQGLQDLTILIVPRQGSNVYVSRVGYSYHPANDTMILTICSNEVL
jgi:hypothetical protein